MATVAWLLAATPSPSGTQAPDPSSVSPGLIGFLATFGLVVVCLLLFASMAGRLRRMRYRAEHEGSADEEPVDEEPEERG